MQISHDYVTRFLGTSIQAPRHKPDVTNDIFVSLINSAGGHQLMIDCSRCTNIESFECLQCCKALQYLDISFTHISDISHIAENCKVLKALNLAHAQILDYSPLCRMESLEVLNLRHSNFIETNLLASLLVLRSLDLGETRVTTIVPLQNLYRLEELLLDGCTYLCQSYNEQPDNLQESQEAILLRETLLKLGSLRLVNFSDIGLSEHWMDSFVAVAHEDLCIEPKSRRDQMLDAVLSNDAINTRRFLQSGISVDLVCEEWSEKVLSATWRTKGKYASNLAQHFIVNHPHVALRPRILHVAIYYNRQKAMRMLIEMNVDMNSRVWLSEVRDYKGQIIINEKKVKRPDTCVIKTPYLPVECSDRGVYNFTEGMIQSSETKWRVLSAAIEQQISTLFLGQWFRDNVILPGNNNDAVIADGAVGDGVAGVEAGQIANSDFPENDVATLAAAKLLHAASESKLEIDADAGTDFDGKTSQGDGSDINTARPNKRRNQKSTIAPKSDRPDWRSHALVAKLLGAPTIMKSSISRREVKILGKKSFWLESKQWAGQEIAAKQEALTKSTMEMRLEEQKYVAERLKVVSLVAPSEEDSLVPEYRSKYDLPIDPSEKKFALPGHGIIKPIAERRKEMRILLNQKLHVDLDD